MAKKQTRRSISVSRSTYERLKAFCETSGISMSQCVETQVGSLLGEEGPAGSQERGGQERVVVSASAAALAADRSSPRLTSNAARPQPAPMRAAPAPVRPVARPAPMTSAAARYAIAPPPPIIKKAEQPAPKAPSMPKADQIFTF